MKVKIKFGATISYSSITTRNRFKMQFKVTVLFGGIAQVSDSLGTVFT